LSRAWLRLGLPRANMLQRCITLSFGIDLASSLCCRCWDLLGRRGPFKGPRRPRVPALRCHAAGSLGERLQTWLSLPVVGWRGGVALQGERLQTWLILPVVGWRGGVAGWRRGGVAARGGGEGSHSVGRQNVDGSCSQLGSKCRRVLKLDSSTLGAHLIARLISLLFSGRYKPRGRGGGGGTGTTNLTRGSRSCRGGVGLQMGLWPD